MTASEIAETLHNGNISDARRAIERVETGAAESAVMALDVVTELAVCFLPLTDDSRPDFDAAIGRVRRCLDPHGEIPRQ